VRRCIYGKEGRTIRGSCPRACGNKTEVKAKATKSLLTAGESINGRHVPEAQLPSAVEQELIKILHN
jgi:hypothetical protein